MLFIDLYPTTLDWTHQRKIAPQIVIKMYTKLYLTKPSTIWYPRDGSHSLDNARNDLFQIKGYSCFFMSHTFWELLSLLRIYLWKFAFFTKSILWEIMTLLTLRVSWLTENILIKTLAESLQRCCCGEVNSQGWYSHTCAW